MNFTGSEGPTGMGKNSRQRNAAKKRTKTRQGRSQSIFEPLGAAGSRYEEAPPREVVEHALTQVAYAKYRGDDAAGLDRAAAPLQALHHRYPALTAQAVMPWLERLVRDIWQGGWQPLDVTEYARRKIDEPMLRALTDVIAAEDRRYPATTTDARWLDQLSEIGAEQWWKDDVPQLAGWAQRLGMSGWEAVLASTSLAGFLLTLPRLPRLLPLPGEGSSRVAADHAGNVDAKILSRIRGLLAKAESTDFDEEADAFTSKAQELMTKYSLDHALVHSADIRPGSDNGPRARRIWVDTPYIDAKTHLVHVVAAANGCKSVSYEHLGFITVLGEEVDLQLVEVLSTSLLVQASRAMLRTKRQVSAYGQSRTRSYRRSFLFAYGDRIGERLREASEATQAGLGDADRERLLPVLARRDDQIEALLDNLFPDVVSRRRSISNPAGWAAGRAAADHASLNARSEVRR